MQEIWSSMKLILGVLFFKEILCLLSFCGGIDSMSVFRSTEKLS